MNCTDSFLIDIVVPWADAEFDLIVLLHDEAGRVDMGLETKRFLNSLFSR